MARLSSWLLGFSLVLGAPACGGAAPEAATQTSVKKLPRANRVAPKHDEEDNDDPALASADPPEAQSAGAPDKKKPRPPAVATAKAKIPAHGAIPPPAPPRPPR